jgi:hypothetical protein
MHNNGSRNGADGPGRPASRWNMTQPTDLTAQVEQFNSSVRAVRRAARPLSASERQAVLNLLSAMRDLIGEDVFDEDGLACLEVNTGNNA